MNPKKKVLFLIHTLQVGGAEKILVNLVNNMDYDKYDITVMTVINTGAFRNLLNKNIKYKTIFNIPFLSNNKKDSAGNKNDSGNLLSNSSKIKNKLAKIYSFMWKHINCEKIYTKYIKDDYDVEIAFLEGISTKIIASSNNKKSKKFAWVHVDLINENKSDAFFKNLNEENLIYSKYDRIITVSQLVKEQFIKKFNKYENKIVVKYNPIDEKDILLKAKDLIEDELKTDKIVICSVGRLAYQKGYDRLINVVNKLNNENLKFELWIIGVGAEEDKIKYLIEKHNIKNVKLLGYKSNPYKYINASDVFVCSSRAEGFSTAVSEAIILEKPIVTTNCAGMREMLGDNNEFGIITENSEQGLYEGLRKMLTDKNVYTHYANKIIKRKNMFNLKNSIGEIEKMVEEEIDELF